jgi:hypothetical protein
MAPYYTIYSMYLRKPVRKFKDGAFVLMSKPVSRPPTYMMARKWRLVLAAANAWTLLLTIMYYVHTYS